MNRIILIGNGFDLAHGMPTKYQDFLDDFWRNLSTEMWTWAYNNNYNDFEHSLIDGINLPYQEFSNKTYNQLIEHFGKYKGKLKFKNIFLQQITEKGNINKWIDIEDEYYSLLKKSFQTENAKYKITELNKDFQIVKDLLSAYLLRVEELTLKDDDAISKTLRYRSRFGHKIFSNIRWRDFSETALNDKSETLYNEYLEYIQSENKALLEHKMPGKQNALFKEMGTEATKKNFTDILLSEIATNYINLIPNNTLFLNFNYTHTDSVYSKQNEFTGNDAANWTELNFIHIHGSIHPLDKNPIIFGFGDELDDEYKTIEKLNDNKYLENIKSIKYSETDNYKKLLAYANSGYYQIFIMGHSCGISDRTLLNTLFEHDNCASIKIFYHQKSEFEDNFSDITRNISRNFNDKAKMRDRVVNKTYCSPLG